MRISDWSSDVCSSDLQFAASAGRQQRQDFGTILHIDHQAHRLAKAASAGQLVRAKRVKAAIGRNEQELIRRLRVKSKGRSENGRASCRERVCQYVSITVGAVSLTIKKKNTE